MKNMLKNYYIFYILQLSIPTIHTKILYNEMSENVYVYETKMYFIGPLTKYLFYAEFENV